jgi:hypothetical protein
MDTNTAGAFIPYPTNRVAGTISDAKQASLVVDRLVKAGFERDAIDVCTERRIYDDWIHLATSMACLRSFSAR